MCVYAKPPFAGPEAVLAYLARYTHRVAISNSRLIALDERGVNFRYKDYRRNARARYRTMTLAPDEFIRRFLLHVLPKGLHRIRHDHRRDLRARGRTPRPAIARGDPFAFIGSECNNRTSEGSAVKGSPGARGHCAERSGTGFCK